MGSACGTSGLRTLNERLSAAQVPLQVANLSTIWTICYTRPSRYNWMLQYYLRAAGLALSWVGTGRLIFSLNYTAAEFAEVADRFLSAARAMQRRRLVVGAGRIDQQSHQARRPQGNDSSALFVAHRIHELSAQQVKR